MHVGVLLVSSTETSHHCHLQHLPVFQATQGAEYVGDAQLVNSGGCCCLDDCPFGFLRGWVENPGGRVCGGMPSWSSLVGAHRQLSWVCVIGLLESTSSGGFTCAVIAVCWTALLHSIANCLCYVLAVYMDNSSLELHHSLPAPINLSSLS